MTDTVGDWLDLVESRWPAADAADWDNVGLQVGDRRDPVSRVLVCLDATVEVINEAAQEPETLLLAHHPLLFRPLEALTPTTAAGRRALAAARAGVAVAAVHTNLDVATDGAGTSDPVLVALGLQDVEPLVTMADRDAGVKLVTFVPPDAVEGVVDAVTATGAGTIGNYTRCTFRCGGTGTYRPGTDASPHRGEAGVDETVEECRVEVVVDRGQVAATLDALRAAHPYEEVAVDLYPLASPPRPSFGRRGRLPEPTTLGELATLLESRLPARHLRFAGDPDQLIETVAVVGGAGDSLIPAAVAAGVDVYITGDLRHHVTLDALELGLNLIDAGHHAVEWAAIPTWLRRLEEGAEERGLVAPVRASAVSTQPWYTPSAGHEGAVTGDKAGEEAVDDETVDEAAVGEAMGER